MPGNFRWLSKIFACFLVVDAATAFTPVWPIQKHLRSQSSHQMNDLTMKKFPLGSQAFHHPVSFCNYGAILGKNDEVYRVSVSLRCSNMRKGDGDLLRECQEELARKEGTVQLLETLQAASPDNRYGILVKELEEQKRKTEEQKREIDEQKRKTEEQKREIEEQKRETDEQKREFEKQKRETEKVNRQLWPIFRAHCISLAVQVLQVFYCEKPKDQPKNVRSVFNDRWLKDEQCIDMIRKNFQVDDSDKRQELCDGFEKMRVGQKSAAVFETQVQDAIVSLDERGTLPTDDAELQLAYKVLQKYRSILVREHNDRKEGWAGGW